MFDSTKMRTEGRALLSSLLLGLDIYIEKSFRKNLLIGVVTIILELLIIHNLTMMIMMHGIKHFRLRAIFIILK